MPAQPSPISSRGAGGEEIKRGISIELRQLSGAVAARAIEAPDTCVPEHSHDWPVLSINLLGSHRKLSAFGAVEIAGPAVVLHAASEAHANIVGAVGMEQVDIMFDPAWLRSCELDMRSLGVRSWAGGPTARAAVALARLWACPDVAEEVLASRTSAFLQAALGGTEANPPTWYPQLRAALHDDSGPAASRLATQLGLHPAWLNTAYRRAAGEGMHETVLRARIERAVTLLRTTDLPAAEIAADAGFCDQSHMIRCFKRVLGRRPSDVREERELLRE